MALMAPDPASTPAPDEDAVWLETFRQRNGGSLPDDVLIEGFVAVLSWVHPDGSRGWRTYHSFDEISCTGLVGLLELGKHKFLSDNYNRDHGIGDFDDDA